MIYDDKLEDIRISLRIIALAQEIAAIQSVRRGNGKTMTNEAITQFVDNVKSLNDLRPNMERTDDK